MVNLRHVLATFLILTIMNASSAFDYSQALDKSLLFFEAQRSGNLPRSQRVNWRGDSSLTDGYQQKVNLVGGYYDAGDHVKFGLPMAYTVTMLSWGAIEYHRSMMDLNQMGHVLDAIKWGTDYFIKWGMLRPYNSSYSNLLLVHAKQGLYCTFCPGIGNLSIMAGVAEPINEQEVAAKYGNIRTEMNQIYSKITELEMEVSEHSLVINAIQPLDPTRRCYRMIGGVLVERTIKEVLPAVQQNKEGIEVVISRLNEALERKKKELTDFETKYKIRIRKNDGDSMDDNSKKEGSAQGVLVGPANA
ncbi:hypothetical protein L2E82_20469 [Cichorium intybus]|uniref:Uncharacterized protein n=1 Tax=Cichorium intybus TaxID=13427 RepID=A0ACB9DTG6_CICIN|nr:hypothetical protein L2E82_20469 [Cichorium intybus]